MSDSSHQRARRVGTQKMTSGMMGSGESSANRILLANQAIFFSVSRFQEIWLMAFSRITFLLIHNRRKRRALPPPSSGLENPSAGATSLNSCTFPLDESGCTAWGLWGLPEVGKGSWWWDKPNNSHYSNHLDTIRTWSPFLLVSKLAESMTAWRSCFIPPTWHYMLYKYL